MPITRDSYSPTLGSPTCTTESQEQEDRIRGLNEKITELQNELRETIYDKDALISVKIEELAHLQERLDGRDTLLSRRQAELDDLRARVREDARVAFHVKQEALDDLEQKYQDEKDRELLQKTEEIDQLQKRLSEATDTRNSTAPPQQQPTVERKVRFFYSYPLLFSRILDLFFLIEFLFSRHSARVCTTRFS